MELTEARAAVDALIAQWHEALPDVQIVLGGSLVSGLFILDAETTAIDVDVRFLAADPDAAGLVQRIEAATGLVYRKTITVGDWPSGESVGHMIEGAMTIPGVDLPLDIEGCLRNRAYVGWARFYQTVLTAEELASFRAQKVALRHDKGAYKSAKQAILATVIARCQAQGIV